MRKSTHTPEYKTIIKELVRIREAAGLNQRQVAAGLGAVPSAVAHIETCERRLDLLEFIWFVKVCDADPLQVFTALLDKIGDTSPKRGSKAR
jgi:transcriptional regulator with XRE-family HTH domain